MTSQLADGTILEALNGSGLRSTSNVLKQKQLIRKLLFHLFGFNIPYRTISRNNVIVLTEPGHLLTRFFALSTKMDA